MILCGMLDLCRIIFWIVVDLIRPRAALEAEILVLRQQIIVVIRTSSEPPLLWSGQVARLDPTILSGFAALGIICAFFQSFNVCTY
jgi:hypothetical protein